MPGAAPDATTKTAAWVAFTIAVLYFAQEVLLPFALAVLLTFLLAPLVSRLRRWGLGRVPAVILVTALTAAIVVSLAAVVAWQIAGLAQDLPKYERNLSAKIDSMEAGTENGTVARLRKMYDRLSARLGADDEVPAAGADDKPVPVEVVEVDAGESATGPLEFALGYLGSLLAPIGVAAVVLVFAVFMLIDREDLRDRLFRLSGVDRLGATTQVLEEAGKRVSRYLLMQLIVNASYGAAVAVGLLVIGLPNAILWGLLATTLRYVPYVGPWIAAAFPITLSVVVSKGWSDPLLIVGMFVVLELISNNVIEPWLYGSGTGVSTMGVLLAAAFWLWLWGPVGLILAMPLTVCLTVVGRHVPQLAFLQVILGDEPVLDPAARLYQRFLSMDADEVDDLVEHLFDPDEPAGWASGEATGAAESPPERTTMAFYDAVLLPALTLAERDRRRGSLDERHERFAHDEARALIAELADRTAAEAPKNGGPVGATTTADGPPAGTPRALVVSARDEADAIAGTALVQLLRARGWDAEALTEETLVSEVAERTATGPHVVVVSALPPGAGAHARSWTRRLRAAAPKLPIIVGLWGGGPGAERLRNRLKDAGADRLSVTLAEAVAHVRALAAAAAATPRTHDAAPTSHGDCPNSNPRPPESQSGSTTTKR
ncbi:AI-2 transport protein TqsA [Alienimonas californiensis]|uniref:AI-2 transport protein TqsA n=1 Tax=Alienimonas californiensis TaxID=2527989 RepID=A0A517P436_9PLAN|nr:AI-2 transport protein TqsA [Alienimonas californiensis]